MTAEQAMAAALADTMGIEPRHEAILATLSAAGWAVVPVVPPRAMSLAGAVVLLATDGGPREAGAVCDLMWAAMLRAAQERPDPS